MTQAAKAQEPSMEEILASIRRIIADEDAAKPAAKAEAKPAPDPNAALDQNSVDAMFATMDATPPEEPAEDDVFDLTESMAAAPEPAPAFQAIDGGQDLEFADSGSEPLPEPPPAPKPVAEAPAPRPAPPPAAPAPPPAEGPLLSQSTAAAVDSAFNTLSQTMLIQNARTLEDLVREMLRPMLKTWLDDNLPEMVERLVRSEIERVRGR